jgi:hypothetical protein
MSDFFHEVTRKTAKMAGRLRDSLCDFVEKSVLQMSFSDQETESFLFEAGIVRIGD